jgi:hypothetical protein
MRSTANTLILALLAVVACGLAAWHRTRGNLDGLFGVPPAALGERLYQDFTPEDVSRIVVTGNGVEAEFMRGLTDWRAVSPWQDRMDPRAAIGIIGFTLGMRVEDSAPLDEINLTEAGLAEGVIKIDLLDRNNEPLARYRLGSLTPWKAQEGEEKTQISTIFVNPRDRGRKEHVYTCTGDILPLFTDGLRFLRDHRPFHFHPAVLGKIRIRGADGELTLGRAASNGAWRVIKPLDLGTDPAAIKTLIEGLYNLQALRVSDRAAVTLPTNGAAAGSRQIGLTMLGSETEILLEIFQPETPESATSLATVSDRPGTVFELPLKPESGMLSLAELPLAVNDLRDPTLTNLNIAAIKAISIKPATGEELVIARNAPKPWSLVIDGREREANEARLFEMLKAVTSGRAIGFESDAATDLTPWGLDKPFLSLRFLDEENQGIELNFGLDGRGGFFVNRLGTATVMRVDESLVKAIATQPYEWRSGRLWNLSRVDLLSIEYTRKGQSTLELRYDDRDENSWKASRDGVDLSGEIEPARANFLLTTLEGVTVSRWLSTTDDGAAEALATPSLNLVVNQKAVDDFGDLANLQRLQLRLAPVPGDRNVMYGHLSSEPHFFLIDRETAVKLAVDLFGKN